MTKILIPETENRHELGRVYYHFLYGLLFPIVKLKIGGYIGSETVYVRGANFDKFRHILDEMRKYNIVDVRPYTSLIKGEYIGLPSMEHYYTGHGVPLRRVLCSDLDYVVNFIRQKMFPSGVIHDAIDILLIERDCDHRIISNIDDLDIAISKLGYKFERRKVGNISFKDQIELFRRTMYTVICQHGSDLANIPFLGGDMVIEVAPKAFIDSGLDYYGALSRQTAVKRVRVEQEFVNSKVDIEKILEYL